MENGCEVLDALKAKMVFWQKKWKIPNTSWSICGYSRSAFRTGFYIPELNLLLDAGPQCFNKPDCILISHTHIDHVACLPLTLIEDVHSNHTVEIYGPLAAESYVKNYVYSMFSLNAMANINHCQGWFGYNGVEAHQELSSLMLNKTELIIEVLECDHAVPTVSYGISEMKTKLRDEYSGLTGKEIAKLRSEGIDVSQKVQQKKLAYVCDTSIAVFDLNKTILEYATIFIECTFLYPDEYDNAKATKHIHWSQLKPFIKNNPNNFFVLFHFSQRYRDCEIEEFLKKEMEENEIKNMYWW